MVLLVPNSSPAQTLAEFVARVRAKPGEYSRDEVIAPLAAEASEPDDSTPEEFQTFLAAEHERCGRAVRGARVQLD